MPNEADLRAQEQWPSAEALAVLAEVRAWIAQKGECYFHELSAAHVESHDTELGLALRELRLRGLTDSAPDRERGLVSCVLIADEEKASYYLDGPNVTLAATPRLRESALACLAF